MLWLSLIQGLGVWLGLRLGFNVKIIVNVRPMSSFMVIVRGRVRVIIISRPTEQLRLGLLLLSDLGLRLVLRVGLAIQLKLGLGLGLGLGKV